MFVQARPTCGAAPVKIEGTKDPTTRLRALSEDNAAETFLIGIIPTEKPAEAEARVHAMFAASKLRSGWFAPTTELLSYVQINAQQAISGLLGDLKRHSHPDGVTTIEEIAAHLGVSVSTVRRMVKAGQIPYLRAGRQLKFIPADVVASLQRG